MAYETGSATDLEDLLDKLNTFAVANGWTQDEFDTVNGDWALSKDTIFVSARWNVATPQHLALYQALAFDGTGTLPGDHSDDSGHGFNASSSHANADLDDQRHVHDIGDGPFTSYHFFEDDDGTRSYINIVVQSEPGVFKHFGFGQIDKYGDWVGGEYCYGYYNDTGSNQTAISATTTELFDGIFTQSMTGVGQRAATVHVEDLPGMGASDLWGAVIGSRTTSMTGDNDANGNVLTRLLGGFRGGPVARWWGQFDGSNTIGFVPMYPIHVWHHQDSNSRVRFLGSLPDVRGISLRNFSEEEEVVIGSDTWVLFPSGRRTADNIAHRSYYQGIAYKKVT